MKRISLNRNVSLLLIGIFIVCTSQVYSQLPASLEKEFVQLYSDIYKALEIISSQSESKAVEELSEIKPELMRKASSLAAKLSEIPDLSQAEEEAWTQKMMEKQVSKDMMTLLSDRNFTAKIENSQVLQQEFEELMSIMDLGSGAEGDETELSGSYAYDDTANDQFVIEIHGDNYIDIMLILEEAVEGKHTFTMEMQVAIDLSNNEGEDYFGLDNHQEEGGGYIQIDQMGDSGELVIGSFHGQFNDYSSGDDRVVNIDGRFSVIRE
jgi:hypothetical protein